MTIRRPPPTPEDAERWLRELAEQVPDLGRRRGEGDTTFRERMRRQPDLDQPPLCLLGVDGVLNIRGRLRLVEEPDFPDQWTRHDTIRGRETYWDIRHPVWLRELEAAGFEMVWSSLWSWQEIMDLATVIGCGDRWTILDFDRFNRDRVLHHDPFGGRTSNQATARKWDLIVEFTGSRPAVIVDADAAGRERLWAEDRTAEGLPTLVLSPWWETGLAREHVDAILAFAAKLRLRSSSVPPSTTTTPS